jgi:ring-1,2-phenylacetyl-CoA epoxidase subunit PaaD
VRAPEAARAAAAAVTDPEVPVLTIEDLGVLRDVEQAEDGRVLVTITPTYSGCPAMEIIAGQVAEAVRAAGFPAVEVHTALSPPWTTDWVTEAGRRKLAEAGIAPPRRHKLSGTGNRVPVSLELRCPRCGSTGTRVVSHFGATACKAIHACRACGEPFEEFKTL